MFVAMNRFRIAPGREADFEAVWRLRDSRLADTPGFIGFKLLRGPSAEDHTLYVSHSMWADRAAFEAWTRSPAFRAAHAQAGDTKGLYLGPPVFEGFDSVVEA
jgi:heme-degrading monooxygenase HmoA